MLAVLVLHCQGSFERIPNHLASKWNHLRLGGGGTVGASKSE